jgi:hypothetical protein
VVVAVIVFAYVVAPGRVVVRVTVTISISVLVVTWPVSCTVVGE